MKTRGRKTTGRKSPAGRQSKAKSASRKTRKKSSAKKRAAPKKDAPPPSPPPPEEIDPATLGQPASRAPSSRMTKKGADTLLNLEEALSLRIVGKREAISKIARVIRVRRAQLDFRPERPDGAFLLVGPAGVGKNEFAYALSEALYGSEDRVISIDLGEVDEEDGLAKLGVSPVPGRDDQLMEGMLTSPVRRDPEAIILLRCLERAHISFQRLLLQILERGVIEDMLGPADFCRNIILVTTHAPKEEPKPTEIGFARSTKTADEMRREQLEGYIFLDLLDAFNEIIHLPPLTPNEVREIARYKVGKVLQRMHKRRREIEVADAVYDELISDEMCRLQGAKFVNRTLEEQLFNPLARYMLSHRANQNIRVEVDRGQIVITGPSGKTGD